MNIRVCRGWERKLFASRCLEDEQLGVRWANHLVEAISQSRDMSSESQGHRIFRVENVWYMMETARKKVGILRQGG